MDEELERLARSRAAFERLRQAQIAQQLANAAAEEAKVLLEEENARSRAAFSQRVQEQQLGLPDILRSQLPQLLGASPFNALQVTSRAMQAALELPPSDQLKLYVFPRIDRILPVARNPNLWLHGQLNYWMWNNLRRDLSVLVEMPDGVFQTFLQLARPNPSVTADFQQLAAKKLFEYGECLIAAYELSENTTRRLDLWSDRVKYEVGRAPPASFLSRITQMLFAETAAAPSSQTFLRLFPYALPQTDAEAARVAELALAIGQPADVPEDQIRLEQHWNRVYPCLLDRCPLTHFMFTRSPELYIRAISAPCFGRPLFATQLNNSFTGISRSDYDFMLQDARFSADFILAQLDRGVRENSLLMQATYRTWIENARLREEAGQGAGGLDADDRTSAELAAESASYLAAAPMRLRTDQEALLRKTLSTIHGRRIDVTAELVRRLGAESAYRALQDVKYTVTFLRGPERMEERVAIMLQIFGGDAVRLRKFLKKAAFRRLLGGDEDKAALKLAYEGVTGVSFGEYDDAEFQEMMERAREARRSRSRDRRRR